MPDQSAATVNLDAAEDALRRLLEAMPHDWANSTPPKAHSPACRRCRGLEALDALVAEVKS